jgi:capsular exopolysaccharide synthesis family protein
MLGAFFAVVIENLDTSIGTIEDVESYLELPVLGVIPHISLERDVSPPPDVKNGDDTFQKYPIVLNLPPKLPAVEAYRSLRTNILFANQEKNVKTIMITSSSLQEGKSINCINTAITLALGGYKTLLVEADLRRGIVDKIFGVDKSPGLSDIILGTQPWKEVLRDFNDIILGSGFDMDLLIKSPELSQLNFITSGVFPSNPAELLNSHQMTTFLEETKQEYDFIIFDCTPVMPVTDAVLLSQKVDSVIILYEVGKIARGVLKRTKSHLENVKANIMGVVLNGVRPEYGPDYYEYHYQYYYSEKEMPPPQSTWEKVKHLWDNRREVMTRENLSHLLGSAKERASRIFSKRHD